MASMALRPSIAALLPSLESKALCIRCARRFARLNIPQHRPISHSLRTRQLAITKDDNADRKFFWANAFHTSQETLSTPQQSQEAFQNAATDSLMTPEAAAIAAPPAYEEPPHRRRKRLKTAAAVDTVSDTQQLPPDASSTLSRDAAAAPAHSFRRIFSTYLALTKPRLAFLIVLTTTASYSIYPVPALLSTSVTTAPSLSTLTLLFLTSGTFLCIASANTLNMLFEPQHDAKMSRTKNRPLVRGLVSKRAAFLFAVATAVAGTSLLWYGVNPTTAILGFGNIALYAFAYTPLKRIHPVNTWVGAIVGAIPPLMGWCAAASQYTPSNASPAASSATTLSTILNEAHSLLLTEQAIGGWLIAALLFAWQFPHFFALSHAVRHEYASAGYKMLTSTNIPMAARVSLRYSFLMFPLCIGLTYYSVTDPAFIATSGLVNAWMLREAYYFWRCNGERGSARALFWASVWQLPIVLVLAMLQKRGLADRVWHSVFGNPDDGDFEEWDDDDASA